MNFIKRNSESRKPTSVQLSLRAHMQTIKHSYELAATGYVPGSYVSRRQHPRSCLWDDTDTYES